MIPALLLGSMAALALTLGIYFFYFSNNCKSISTTQYKNIDKGIEDTRRGWYKIDNCGGKTNYCSWWGSNGSGGNPANYTPRPSSDEIYHSMLRHSDNNELDESERSDSYWRCHSVGADGNIKVRYRWPNGFKGTLLKNEPSFCLTAPCPLSQLSHLGIYV